VNCQEENPFTRASPIHGSDFPASEALCFENPPAYKLAGSRGYSFFVHRRTLLRIPAIVSSNPLAEAKKARKGDCQGSIFSVLWKKIFPFLHFSGSFSSNG
jgi:hypothetical protein